MWLKANIIAECYKKITQIEPHIDPLSVNDPYMRHAFQTYINALILYILIFLLFCLQNISSFELILKVIYTNILDSKIVFNNFLKIWISLKYYENKVLRYKNFVFFMAEMGSLINFT